MSRVSSGLAGLDALIDGGFPQKSCILVAGGAGTGKTLFGLNFTANGANTDEKSCYISFNEDAAGLLRASESTGLGVDRVAIKHMDLTEDITVTEFMKTIESYPELDRLIIDSVNKLLLFSRDEVDYRYQLHRLVRFLRKNVKSSLLICETDGEAMDTGNGEAFECDGVVDLSFLDLEERPMRTLQIHKMRYTAIEPKVAHELVIDSKGLRLSKKKVI
jgi:circadian clock protein KaiC